MKKVITAVLILLGVTVTIAQNGKKIKGNGNEVTLERTTESYTGISIGGFFDVELIEGKEGIITLKGEDNILEHIEVEVVNGTLIIKKRKNLNLRASHGIGVFITIPVESIDAIRLSGSGKLYSKKTLKSDSFSIRTSGSRYLDLAIVAKSVTIRTSGSSHVNLKGNANKLDITSSGSSNVNAYDLEADNVHHTGSGSSRLKVTTNESLNVRVSGSGNVKYKGNVEKIKSKTSGSGRISKG